VESCRTVTLSVGAQVPGSSSGRGSRITGDAPPLPGEEARYAQVLAVLAAAKADPQIKQAMTDGAQEADKELAERDKVFLPRPRLERRPLGQRQPLHRHVREGRHAAGARLLVALDLQRTSLLRRQRDINRFSVGTKNKDLKSGNDGSLTIYVQTDRPKDDTQRANWLPAPTGDFSLYVRTYWPKTEVTGGQWTPPAVVKA